MKATATLTASLGLALGSLHAQTVPPFINYQGKVTDSAGIGLGTGTPVNRKVIFRIFDAATGGERLWSEQHTVTIANGEFSVLLGNGINANYAGADETPLKTATPLDTVFTSSGILRYVEIVVDNGDNTLNAGDAPIAPRQQITSTAYSFRARSADTIASGSDLQLNGSANYGLGYYGTTRLFNGAAVDGPVLFGQAGGALGSVNGGTKNIALRWNAAGNVGIGSADLAGAAATTKLVLQGDDSNTVPLQLNIRGNSDTNKRLLLGYNTTSNYGSLQAYSAASTATNLLLNPSGGNVGIGVAIPTQKLDVNGNAQVSGNVMLSTTADSGTAGLIQLGSARIHSYGTNNLFAGSDAGNFTMTGIYNVGMGFKALRSNTTGTSNTGIGLNALLFNTTGSNNTAVGDFCLGFNTTGSYNTAIGTGAGPFYTDLTNTTCVGYGAWADASNTVRLGDDSVTLFRCKVGLTVTSDRNLKENFEPVDGAEVLRKIRGMNLTSWNYIGDDKTKFRHYGPMAQDFFAAFGQDAVGTVGTSTTINSGDQSGVMLSAIQELARKLEAKDAEVKALQETSAQVSILQQRLADLEAKERARDAKMASIEKLLESPDQPATRTISLKAE